MFSATAVLCAAAPLSQVNETVGLILDDWRDAGDDRRCAEHWSPASTQPTGRPPELRFKPTQRGRGDATHSGQQHPTAARTIQGSAQPGRNRRKLASPIKVTPVHEGPISLLSDDEDAAPAEMLRQVPHKRRNHTSTSAPSQLLEVGIAARLHAAVRIADC
jgi:hypothetical protein